MAIESCIAIASHLITVDITTGRKVNNKKHDRIQSVERGGRLDREKSEVTIDDALATSDDSFLGI